MVNLRQAIARARITRAEHSNARVQAIASSRLKKNKTKAGEMKAKVDEIGQNSSRSRIKWGERCNFAISQESHETGTVDKSPSRHFVLGVWGERYEDEEGRY